MSRNNKNNTTIIPSKYIEGEEQLSSDKLFLLLILFQGLTDKNKIMFNVRYLCDRLDSTTRNTNRTKYIIETLKYFQQKQIIFFSDIYNCGHEINIEDFTNENKMDIVFGEIYSNENEKWLKICDNDVDYILEHCKNNKINKYMIIQFYLYILNKLNEKFICIDFGEIIINLHLSKDTIEKYIFILEELKMIKYKIVGVNKISSNKFLKTNLYVYDYNNIEQEEKIITLINEDKDMELLNINKKIDKNIKKYKLHYNELEILELKGVYCIRNIDNKMIKIGVANNISKRFKEIESSFRFCGIEPHLKIELFIEINNNYELESYLHKEFSNCNYRNEWFDIENINEIIEKLPQ